MLQAVLVKPGTVEIREVPTPEPGPGELVVRVRSALTCGTDLKAFRRGHPLIPMPGPFGHEYSGDIYKKGKGVRSFKEGDPVMGVHSAPCMECALCKKGLHNLCPELPKKLALGSFAEYLLIPAHIVARNLFKKPTLLGYKEAALLEPLACVLHGIRPLKIKNGDTALVIGGGPIGLLHLLVLIKSGARVAVLDPHDSRLRAARRMGAEIALDQSDSEKAVKKITGWLGFDHVFECTGRPEVWEASVQYLRPGGVLTLFGGCPKGTRVTYDTYALHYGELTLRGVFHYTPDDVKSARRMLISHDLDTSGMISGEYRLKDIHKALEKLSRGEGVKYAIIP